MKGYLPIIILFVAFALLTYMVFSRRSAQYLTEQRLLCMAKCDYDNNGQLNNDCYTKCQNLK